MATKKQERLRQFIEDFKKEVRDAEREVTHEEFIDAFKQVVAFVKQIKQENMQEVASMKEISAKEAKKLEEKANKTEQSLKSEINKAFSQAFSEQQGALNFIRDKVSTYEKNRAKDEDRIIQELLGLIPELPTMPPDLSAEVNDIKEILERLEKKIEEVDKKPVRTGGGGGTSAIGVASAMKNIVKNETPSGLINGSNTTYTVTKPINAILSFGINGQVIHPSEYSYSGKTITFTTAIPAGLSGTTFEIVYV